VSWVSRRLALVEVLPEAIQQQVREGKIPAQVALKFLVPVARQIRRRTTARRFRVWYRVLRAQWRLLSRYRTPRRRRAGVSPRHLPGVQSI